MSLFQHDYIKLGKVTLHIAHAGPTAGPLIIFLHGFPENWAGWRYQIKYFANKGYKAVAIDQRGFNISSKPKYVHDYRIDLLAIDVIHVIKYFKREKAILVGHDWGANVSWWCALRFPSYIEKLIILNVPHPLVMKKMLTTNVRQIFKSWYIFFLQLPLLPEFFVNINQGLLLSTLMTTSANKHTFSPEILSYYRNSWTKECVHSIINWYRGMKLGSAGRLTSVKIKPKTLLIWGLKDRFIGKEGIKPSLKLCEDCSVIVYKNHTHWLIHEIPNEINSKIFKFLIA